MTRAELQTALRLPYDRARWLGLLRELLPTTEIPRTAQPLGLADTQANAAASSAVQIARIPLVGGKSVAVLEVTVNGRVDLHRNRVALRNLVAGFIDQDRAHAVLGLFHGEGEDYRFSFVARSSEFSADGELTRRETEKRRYTYMLGRGQACRTPAERLDGLRTKGRDATLDDLLHAFKVEPLFKEFFKDYGRVFDQVEGLIRPTLTEKETLRLFTQRLFNRLMFLAFVERKGWLRFHQRTDYLAALWDSRRKGKDANFYRDHVVPLFFEGLNQPDRPTGHSDERFGTVPYLNGGLFEKAEDGTDERPNLIVPDSALDSIFTELFARYNFTVAESTPLDVEVALDPEMLGKVFEELVTGRHEQGSYYTPKPIASFMCRETLVNHLASRCNKESRPALEAFVHSHDAGQLQDAEAVLRALRGVTVCDPACGSGAYLLGMLHELLDLRTCLFAANQKLDSHTAHERKLEIIERNLYGVDKDPFAVNIARLRLWLSLAVEYDGSQPPPALPNLDFKIEQGDCLAAPAPSDVLRDAGSLPLLLPTVLDFAAKKAKFLTAHGAKKEALRAEIAALKQSLKTWLATEGPADAFHWALEFAEVFIPTPAGSSLTGGLNLGLELASGATPGGFDIVVANPPYVRMELIKPQKPILRKRFPHVHADRADLYIYFYARAHEVLRDGGTAAFISSNKWLRAGYGESLRRHLLDAQAFGIVMDFGELPVFEAAATDAAIFIWEKRPRCDATTRWAMVKNLDRCYAEGVRTHFLRCFESLPASQFGTGKPRLMTGTNTVLRAKLQANGVPLGELIGKPSMMGIKTGLNAAFVVKTEIRDSLVARSERNAEILKPFLAGDDVRRYELHFRGDFLINTVHGIDMRPYAAVVEHLRPFRAKLETRATNQAWYELQQPQTAYREFFEGPKIVYGQIMMHPRFYLDTNGFYTNQKCYFLPTGDWFILAVLNSTPAWTFLKSISVGFGDPDEGGRLEPRIDHIAAIPIPAAGDAKREEVGGLAERVQALHGRRRARVEHFLRDLGLDPTRSTSRNPLEQPWTLSPVEFAKRSKPLQRVARERPQHLYGSARDETASLTEQITKLEAEIDARVAALYGLDAEDRRWAAKAAPSAQPDDKQALLFRVLATLKEKAAYFPLKAIQSAANDAELTLKDSTLKGYLVEAVAQGLLHDAGRGWYSRLAEPFVLNGKPVAVLLRTLEKAFPQLEFSCWSTEQVAPYGHHLLSKFVSFVHTERDAMESVGDRLRDAGWEVTVNPRGVAVRDFTIRGNRTVVIRPRTTTQPIEAHQVTIEGLLVELFIEANALKLMDTGEYLQVLANLAGQRRIRLAALLDYARERRPIGMELTEHINADFLKNSALDGSRTNA